MRLHERARVTRDIPEDGLKKGDLVVVLDDFGMGRFSVEAVDEDHPDPVAFLMAEDLQQPA